jgi:hypothetical protein
MLVGGIAIACDDGTTGNGDFTLDDFIGIWEAADATLTSEVLADSSVSLSSLGVTSLTLEVGEVAGDGTYIFTAWAGSFPALADTGTFVLVSNTEFSIIPSDGDPLDGTYTLTNNKTHLSIDLPGTDIWVDPTFNPATLEAVFDKQ